MSSAASTGNGPISWSASPTAHGKTDMEYAISLKSILEIHQISPASIEGAILSSVVPPLNAALSSAVEKICGFRPMLVGAGMKTGLNILMDNPKTVGSDMIVDAVAAIRDYPCPLIIIDMGTATTMSVVDQARQLHRRRHPCRAFGSPWIL